MQYLHRVFSISFPPLINSIRMISLVVLIFFTGLYKTVRNLFTRFFGASLASSTIGFLVAAAPCFWIIFDLDVGGSRNRVETILPADDFLVYFPFGSFQYSSLYALVNDVLILGIALGVTTAITWSESTMNSTKSKFPGMGGWANLAFALSVIGLVVTFLLLIALAPTHYETGLSTQRLAGYIVGAYYVVAAIVLFYFSTILSMRYKEDSGAR